jgi:isoquinoline 1-oxidoreductase beta subunit
VRRRAWLLSGLGAAGALVVGWTLLPPRERLGGLDSLAAAAGEVGLNGWIKIAADGGVLLAMNRSEMGQGVHTALAMLAAEELDVPLARIPLIAAGADRLYGNVAMFVGQLPFHTADGEPDRESDLVRGARWMTRKVARELGINATGGSSSVADAWDVLRIAAATARARLVGAASIAWKQPVGELVVTDGIVSHPSGLSAHSASSPAWRRRRRAARSA